MQWGTRYTHHDENPCIAHRTACDCDESSPASGSIVLVPDLFLARPRGLEPLTPGFGGRCTANCASSAWAAGGNRTHILQMFEIWRSSIELRLHGREGRRLTFDAGRSRRALSGCFPMEPLVGVEPTVYGLEHRCTSVVPQGLGRECGIRTHGADVTSSAS